MFEVRRLGFLACLHASSSGPGSGSGSDSALVSFSVRLSVYLSHDLFLCFTVSSPLNKVATSQLTIKLRCDATLPHQATLDAAFQTGLQLIAAAPDPSKTEL